VADIERRLPAWRERLNNGWFDVWSTRLLKLSKVVAAVDAGQQGLSAPEEVQVGCVVQHPFLGLTVIARIIPISDKTKYELLDLSWAKKRTRVFVSAPNVVAVGPETAVTWRPPGWL
jgi:hypothetical protein